jgi:hypothetical protein
MDGLGNQGGYRGLGNGSECHVLEVGAKGWVDRVAGDGRPPAIRSDRDAWHSYHYFSSAPTLNRPSRLWNQAQTAV